MEIGRKYAGKWTLWNFLNCIDFASGGRDIESGLEFDNTWTDSGEPLE